MINNDKKSFLERLCFDTEQFIEQINEHINAHLFYVFFIDFRSIRLATRIWCRYYINFIIVVLIWYKTVMIKKIKYISKLKSLLWSLCSWHYYTSKTNTLALVFVIKCTYLTVVKCFLWDQKSDWRVYCKHKIKSSKKPRSLWRKSERSFNLLHSLVTNKKSISFYACMARLRFWRPCLSSPNSSLKSYLTTGQKHC